MEIITGKIVDAGPGYITIRAAYDNTERMLVRRYDEVQVGLEDGRKIHPEQRRKAFALLGEIAAWSGYSKDEAHLTLKHEFVQKHLDQLQRELFSLADCDVTTAREYISYLIEFCLTFDVPTRQPLAELCDDVERYVYGCLIHKKCCVCGQKAETHHWTRIGMGANRKTMVHVGLPLEPLCREHHTECHTMAQEEFDAKYHICPVKATTQICKKLGLKHNAD